MVDWWQYLISSPVNRRRIAVSSTEREMCDYNSRLDPNTSAHNKSLYYLLYPNQHDDFISTNIREFEIMKLVR